MPNPLCNRADNNRPTWLLVSMAISIASVLALILPNPYNCSQALLVLFGAIQDPSYLERIAAGMASKLVLPALVVFVLLRLTRLGSWLVPNRLAAGCLAGASVVMVSVAGIRLYLAASGRPGYLPGPVSDVLTPIVIALLAVGLTMLVASTVWHRLIADKERARRAAHLLLRRL